MTFFREIGKISLNIRKQTNCSMFESKVDSILPFYNLLGNFLYLIGEGANCDLKVGLSLNIKSIISI